MAGQGSVQGLYLLPDGHFRAKKRLACGKEESFPALLTVGTEELLRTSLAVQWSRIHLPMQETRVPPVIREDPTCRRAIKPMRHNYRACVPEPGGHDY